MGDDNHCQLPALFGQLLQRTVYFVLRTVVQGRCGLIEEQHFGFLVQGTGYADALLLPAGKAASVFTQRGIQPLRQGLGPILQADLLQHLHHLCAVGLRVS